MNPLGIHILGWLAITFFFLSFVLGSRILRTSPEKSSKIDFKRGLKVLSPALLSILFLLTSYLQGKDLPFKTPPRIYKEALSYAESNGLINNQDVKNSLAYCGMGNMHRCLFEMMVLVGKSKEKDKLIEMVGIISDGIEKQKNSEKFLE